MTHRSFLLALGCIVTFASSSEAQSLNQDAMKSDLETVYNTWRQSMLRNNYEGWQAQTSTYRKVRVRNLAVSEKKPFPQSLFRKDIAPPSLMPLKYIGAVVKGSTAAATYFGKIDWGIGGQPTENAYVLLFTKEKGVWKYDQARFFNLSHLPKVRARLRNADASVLHQQDGFQPSGTIPPVPPLCPAPQYIAKIFIDCQGRSVDATVNNVSSHHFEDMRDAEIISGGVHNGLNTVSLRFADIQGKKQGSVAVMIYIMPETPGNYPGKTFEYIITGDKKPTNRQFSFTVTPEIIRKMSEKRLSKKPPIKVSAKEKSN
ncbi:MAG: hypothetical protein RR373_03125 [Akkermansia sp.]